MNSTQSTRAPRWVRAFLWVVSLAIMLGAATYQRTTGPTYPLVGEATIGGRMIAYELIRSETTDRDARVAVPQPGSTASGTVSYKRYGTDDELTALPLSPAADSLVAFLPRQPAAGKVAYFLEIRDGGDQVRIPAEGTIVMRFKDPVPLGVLLSHVALMFFGMMVGVRAALAAAVDPGGARILTLAALLMMTVGGMILGPIVQKYAFDAYWTGFPFGFDLTDNKTLIMWVVWVAAAAAFLSKARAGWARAFVGLAAVVMLVVYMIPHSLGGSELNYDAVDRGIDPSEAIGTERLSN